MQISPDVSRSIAAPKPEAGGRNAVLMAQAQSLEAAFLSEMLSYAGFGAAQESFGGGIGEEQYSSFLREQQAAQMVKAGGIGLAEQLFRALTRADHGA